MKERGLDGVRDGERNKETAEGAVRDKEMDVEEIKDSRL
jgi:hypothetical protein